MKGAVRDLEAAISGRGGVLVSGESGTGREVIARAIHQATHDEFDGSVERLLKRAMRSRPNGRPFVVVDCAEVRNLEETLFGEPVDDAFTNVQALDIVSEASALHVAMGGTLVLRHLPEMPTRLQLRLARILRDGEVGIRFPSGAVVIKAISLRPIATKELGTTHQLVPDLLKRIAHTRIQLPPLRERREDIPGLVRLLLVDICDKLGVSTKIVSNQALELLTALPWRGNLKELRDLLHTLAASTSGRLIRLSDILANVRLDATTPASVYSYSGTLREAREQFERDYVKQVLEQHRGRMSEAAKALGLQRTNLYRKVRQLSVPRRRPGSRVS